MLHEKCPKTHINHTENIQGIFKPLLADLLFFLVKWSSVNEVHSNRGGIAQYQYNIWVLLDELRWPHMSYSKDGVLLVLCVCLGKMVNICD